MAEIVAVNRGIGMALTDTDGPVHITEFIGSDGQPCDEHEAVAAVGWEPDPGGQGGRWWAINLAEFQKEKMQ
jgi:hypothetical protein